MECIVQRPSTGPEPYLNAIVEVDLNRIDGTWGILKSLRVKAQFSAASTPVQYLKLPVIHKGYCDTHLHAVWMAAQKENLNLSQAHSPEEVFRLIADRVKGTPRSFLHAEGWDHERYGLSAETFSEQFVKFCRENSIDGVAFRVCGHLAVISESLAKRWGFSSAGLMKDLELETLHQKLFCWSCEDTQRYFEHSQELLLSKGITALSEMSLQTEQLKGFLELARRGKLKVNIQAVLDHRIADPFFKAGPFVETNASDVGPLGNPAQLQVRHVKRFLDGSLGARTAWLSEAYDDVESFGDSLINDQELFEWARAALKNGWLLSFHSIGDAALAQIARLSEECREFLKQAILSEYSSFKFSTHHRIEHAQVMSDEILHQLVSHQMWTFLVQPYHRVADESFVIRRLGPTRFYNEAYRLNSIFALQGSRVGIGSDAPVASWSPSHLIAAAISHPNPRERVDWLTAIWLYTTGAKLALGIDPGVLKAGSTVVISEPQ